MQRQKLYSFSYLEWRIPTNTHGHQIPGSKPFKKRITQWIMVCLDRTRKGQSVIKTRDNWDNESTTQLELPPLPLGKLDSMKSCYYFWNCMQYAACLALADEFDGGDACLKDGVDAYIEVKKLPIPKYGDDNIDYFKLMADLFPSLKLKRVENGF